MSMLDLNIEGKVNWHVFYVRGFQIENQDNWREALFDNATFVNSVQLKEYLETFDKSMKYENFIFLLENEKPQTFLIVQYFDKIEDNSEQELHAYNRALEIIACLYFAIFFSSNYIFGVSLDRQIYNSPKHRHNILTNYKKYVENYKSFSDEFPILIPENDYLYSRNTLIHLISNPKFVDIFNFVIKNNSNNLINALVHFYLCTNVPSAHSQLIGCITAIDLMFQSGKDDNRLNRLKILLLEKDFEDFVKANKGNDNENKIDGIFAVRNNLIHNGKSTNDSDVYRAIFVTTRLFIYYSKLLTSLGTKIDICNYLDTLELISRSKKLTLEFKDLFEIYLNHIDYSLTDYYIPHVIAYYGLCNPNIPQKIDLQKQYAKAILKLQEKKNADFETAYNLLISGIYYRIENFPFADIEDFRAYLKQTSNNFDKELKTDNKSYFDFIESK